MPSVRNLRRSVLGLAFVLALLGIVFIGLRFRGSDRLAAEPASKGGESVEPAIKEPEIRFEERGRLEPETPVEAELSGLEGHRYEFTLEAGHFGHLVVEQKGIDVIVRFYRPDGKKGTVDNPYGPDGPEIVYDVAESAGTYQLEIFCEIPTAPSGRYEVRLRPPRPATERDQQHLLAWRTFRKGETLRFKDKKYREALAKYEEALPVWNELKDDWWRAEALYRIGWMHLNLNESRAALPFLYEAAALFHDLGRRIPEGLALDRAARAHYLLSEDVKSLEAARRAREIFRAAQAPDVEASALNNMGNALTVLGQVREAQEAFQEALARAQEGGAEWEEGMALYGIGDLLIVQGKLEAALDHLQRALVIVKRYDRTSDEAGTLTRIANAQQRLGDLDAARAGLEEALPLYRSIGDRRGEATILNSLGTVHLLQNRTDAAGESYRQALAIFRQIGHAHGESFALHNLARHAYAIEDDQRAYELHEQAAARFKEMKNRPGEISALFGSARALHRLGEYAAANQRLERVLGGLESLRSESDNIDLRTGYLATKQHYYDLHVDVLMNLHEQHPMVGYAARALAIHERRRARGLLDLLAGARPKIRRGIDPTLLDREGKLQEQINSLDQQLNNLRMEQKAKERIQTLEQEQRTALLELENVRTEIRRQSPRAAAAAQREPLTVPEMQDKVVGDRSILLVYALGEGRSFLWLVPHRGEIISHPLPTRSWIESAAHQAQRALSSRGRKERDDHWLSELSKILLQPVAEQLEDKRLVIVADGALESLPFAALPDPRESETVPLIAKHEIVVLPSASVLAALRRDLFDRLPAARRIAVVADPVFGKNDSRLAAVTGTIAQVEGLDSVSSDLQRSARDLGFDGFARLPFTEEEARLIRDFVSEDQRFEAMGFQASRETVLSGRLRRYRVLHFATHGLLNSKHPELSGLVLSLFDEKGNPQDGFLRSYEIASLDLPAELAVLSACQTGLGSEVRGEGVIGLPRSFMDAGVPRVIVSLWNVNDRGTAELMQRFYRGLFKERLRPAEALRCAQLSMIEDEQWSDPYYWAPFVFQGEWRLEVRTGGDDGIETRVGGSGVGSRSDDDLPPPLQGVAEKTGCPPPE